MKQEISALMDGELFDDEAEALLDKIKRSPDNHDEWHLYHVVGDVLRQSDHFYADMSSGLRERLRVEPTVLAPRSRVKQKVKWFVLSAAASVMAMALVAWMSLQISSEPNQQISLHQKLDALHPASFPVKPAMNDYLMAHQEFSPSTEVQGAASFIRTVARQ